MFTIIVLRSFNNVKPCLINSSENEINNFANSSTINPRLKIIAPISGTIDQHLIDLGQSVIAYDKMLSIIDLSKVLIRGYVSPEDAPELKEGNKIKVTQKNIETKFVEGSISTINPALDETNKSIVINAVINTKNNWPKIASHEVITPNFLQYSAPHI